MFVGVPLGEGMVAVAVGSVAVGVPVAVTIAVSVATAFNVTTSSGARLPSREENVDPSLLSATNTRV